MSESYDEKRQLLTELKAFLDDFVLEQEAKSAKDAKNKAIKVEGAELIRERALATMGKRKNQETENDNTSPPKTKAIETLLSVLQNDDAAKLEREKWNHAKVLEREKWEHEKAMKEMALQQQNRDRQFQQTIMQQQQYMMQQ